MACHPQQPDAVKQADTTCVRPRWYHDYRGHINASVFKDLIVHLLRYRGDIDENINLTHFLPDLHSNGLKLPLIVFNASQCASSKCIPVPSLVMEQTSVSGSARIRLVKCG